MRYIQTNIPSPARIYSFNLTDFVGGLNNRENIIDENQCSSVMNMAFTPDGVMMKRKGITWFDDFEINDPVTYIDQYAPNKEVMTLIRASNKEMYMDGTLIRNLGGQMKGVNFEGRYFFADSAGFWCYGKFEEPSGTYIQHIGTPSSNFALMEVIPPPFDYTPLGNTHVQGKRVYDWNQRKVWYEPCQLELEDTFKQGNIVPNKPRFVVAKEGRLYVAGTDDNDDTVYITDVGNPFYFPSALGLQVTPNADRITGLAIYNNAIIIGRRMDMYAIRGNTNRTDSSGELFRIITLNTHFGVANQRCMINAHNFLFFLGTDSQFYALRYVEGSTDTLQTQVISKTVDIHNAPISVSKDDIWYSSAQFYDDHLYVSLGDKVLVYSYLRQAWTVYNNIKATSFYALFNTLLIGTSEGRIVIQGTNYLDNGVPYQAHWTSKWFDMGDANAFKMFRDFFIVTKSEEGFNSSVNMEFQVDYFNTERVTTLQTKFSVWGESVYGDLFITRAINQSSPFMIFQRGRQIRVTFKNAEFINQKVDTEEELELIQGIYDGMLVQVGEDRLFRHENFDWIETNANYYNENMSILQLSGEYEFKWKR